MRTTEGQAVGHQRPQKPVSEGGERPGKVHPKEALFGGRSILKAGLPVPFRTTLAKAQGSVKLLSSALQLS